MERLDSFVTPLPAERARLQTALGRTLATDIVAPVSLPRFDNSAMDGYALNTRDIVTASTAAPVELVIAGSVEAGQQWTDRLAPGSCVRIGTGAAMPPGADAVTPYERVVVLSTSIMVFEPLTAGANVRALGEDVSSGAIVINAGATIRPQDVALLSALGLTELPVVRAPQVAILSLGPELMPDALPTTCNDANGPMLATMARQMGAEITAEHCCAGEPAELSELLAGLSQRADLILSSGGVSNGAADSMVASLERFPDVELWELRLRPGKHFAAGRIGDAAMIALPGNPVAALVGFLLLAGPALRHLGGHPHRMPWFARAAHPLVGGANRLDALRGFAEPDSAGFLRVWPVENRGSGIISSLRQANCLILLDEGRDQVAAGEAVEIRWVEYQ